jgi:hypothetical protein
MVTAWDLFSLRERQIGLDNLAGDYLTRPICMAEIGNQRLRQLSVAFRILHIVGKNRECDFVIAQHLGLPGSSSAALC